MSTSQLDPFDSQYFINKLKERQAAIIAEKEEQRIAPTRAVLQLIGEAIDRLKDGEGFVEIDARPFKTLDYDQQQLVKSQLSSQGFGTQIIGTGNGQVLEVFLPNAAR